MGNTALHTVSGYCRLDVVAAVLEAKADVNAENEVRPPCGETMGEQCCSLGTHRWEQLKTNLSWRYCGKLAAGNSV